MLVPVLLLLLVQMLVPLGICLGVLLCILWKFQQQQPGVASKRVQTIHCIGPFDTYYNSTPDQASSFVLTMPHGTCIARMNVVHRMTTIRLLRLYLRTYPHTSTVVLHPEQREPAKPKEWKRTLLLCRSFLSHVTIVVPEV